MATANVNGIDLYYEVRGAGPTLVWLHGLMEAIARSREIGEGVEELAERGFRVVSYDARGHGESGYTEDESHYTVQAHAEDMAALFDHLGIERAHLGGRSMGAGVSICLALAHPERVERLVLLLPPALAATLGPPQQVFGGLATLIEAQGLEQAVDVAMQLPQFVELRETDPQEYESMRGWLLSQRPASVVPAIRGLLVNGPPLPEERFAEIRAPALIVGQPDDEIHPASSAETLHAAIAGSRLLMAPTFDYYRSHHDELLDAVASFLREDVAGK